MDNTITVEGFTFEVLTEINKSGVQVVFSLKSISEKLKQILLELLPLKKEALKYTRHSKKRDKLTRWINDAQKYLALD